MATTADFKGLDWLAHRLAERDDMTEHHKVECIWARFPGAPVGLVRHVLALGEHDPVRCPPHIAPSDVVDHYADWRPGSVSWDQLYSSAMRAKRSEPLSAPQAQDTSEAPSGAPEATQAPGPAINELVAAAHALVDHPHLVALREAGQQPGPAFVRLQRALEAFQNEQHEASEAQRAAAEQADALNHAHDPVT